jgi:phenylacetate-coenzyme A ligase PaaK-like adenylate-forming protein
MSDIDHRTTTSALLGMSIRILFVQIRRRCGRLLREILLGPAYWWHHSLIQRSKTWSNAKQQRYQERKTRRVFAHYDRNLVRSKTHYLDNSGHYDRLCLPGLTKLVRTGGTSGFPFVFRRDTLSRGQKERAYLFDIWAMAGYHPFDLRVVFRGNVGKELISYNWLENSYNISPSILTNANRSELVDFLQSLPQFFLHVYPSSLFTFIDIVEEGVFRRLPIRGVLAGSEVFPPIQRESFERRFGIPIAHWYGHSEYATLARCCRVCGGFHFYPTYGYTEFVPIEGDRYRIVVTSFNIFGTQFVRYDTSDIAILSSRVCAEPFMRVDSIEGREQEYFIDSDGKRRAFGPYLFGIHDDFWNRILAIQFLQQHPGQLDVKVVIRDNSDRSWLEDYLRKRFAVCDLHFEYVGQIPRTETGKHRYYVSQLR